MRKRAMNFCMPMGASFHPDDDPDIEPASFYFKEDDVHRYTSPALYLAAYDPFEPRRVHDDGIPLPPLYSRAVQLHQRTAALCAYHTSMYMTRRDRAMFECWFQQMSSASESVVYTLEKAYGARDAHYPNKVLTYLRVARGSIFETLVLLEFFPVTPFGALLEKWQTFLEDFDGIFIAYTNEVIDAHRSSRPLEYTKDDVVAAVVRTRTRPLAIYTTLLALARSLLDALALCNLAMPSAQWSRYARAMMRVSKDLNSVLFNIQEGYAYLSISKLRSFLCIADGHMRSVFSAVVLYRDGVKLPPGIHRAFCHETSECMTLLATFVHTISMRPNGFPHELVADAPSDSPHNDEHE